MSRKAVQPAASSTQIIEISVAELLAQVRQANAEGAASMRSNFATLQDALDARERSLAAREKAYLEIHDRMQVAYKELERFSSTAANLVLLDAQKEVAVLKMKQQGEALKELFETARPLTAMLPEFMRGDAAQMRELRAAVYEVFGHPDLCAQIQATVGKERWKVIIDWAAGPGESSSC